MADENTNSMFGDFGKMPSFDFTKLMKDFKLPGIDLATIMDREKKNIEALTEANRVAFEGWQALVHRQAEILQESIKQAVGTMQGEDAGTQRMDVAAHAFETVLSNMRELAEMAAKSQKEAFDIIRKRRRKSRRTSSPWNCRVGRMGLHPAGEYSERGANGVSMKLITRRRSAA